MTGRTPNRASVKLGLRFSIIIPVYDSHTTLERCIEGVCRQEFREFETIFVDSSPNDLSWNILGNHPELLRFRSRQRLLMHAARNIGVRESHGDILVFTDPDCVAAPNWLSQLDVAFRNAHEVVGGSINCYPGSSVDSCAHIVKFSKWLPNGPDGFVEDLVTANFAISRKAFDAIGAFDDRFMSGDTELSYRLRSRGVSLFFASQASVMHIHEMTLPGLLRERFRRGIDFGSMRAMRERWRAHTVLVFTLGLPFLILRQTYWKWETCRRRNFGRDFLRATLPVLLSDSAWMIGVSLGSAKLVSGRRAE